jgi:multidrug transporter EmrE-like cation transporter
MVGLLTAFVTLSAIGGGVAMLTGVDQFPLDWLAGTTFPDYTLPAHVLAIAVGGSSLVAVIATLRNHPLAGSYAVIAGLLMMGFVTIEVIILQQQPPGPTPIEIFYFIIGLLMLGLGGWWVRLRGAAAA